MNVLLRASEIKQQVDLIDVEIKKLKTFLDFATNNDLDDLMEIRLPNIVEKKEITGINIFDIDSMKNIGSQNVELSDDVIDSIKYQLNSIKQNIEKTIEQNGESSFKLTQSEIIILVSKLYDLRISARKMLTDEFINLQLSITL